MANISDAWGVIDIIASTKEAILDFKKIFEETESWCYPTAINDEISPIQDADGTWRAEVNFFGSGRNTYEYNASTFFNGFDFDESSNIVEASVSVAFDFHEIEYGLAFCGSGFVKLAKEAGEPLSAMKIESHSYEWKDLSIEALHEIGESTELYTDGSVEGIEKFIDWAEEFGYELPEGLVDADVEELAKKVKWDSVVHLESEWDIEAFTEALVEAWTAETL